MAIKPNGPRLLFLCGGNKEKDVPSARRAALSQFVQKYYPNVKVIFAENVYREMLSPSKKSNLFDLESKIFNVSDYVLIILEGYGSFCELGAFSHQSLREKLVVINDEKQKYSDSFVSLGPLRAISEAKNGEVLFYPMDPEGRQNPDRIADTFEDISRILEKPAAPYKHSLGDSDVAPVGTLTKEKLFFVHNLIHFYGNPNTSNLVNIFIKFFGNQDFRLKSEILAILISIGFVRKKDEGFASSIKEPIFDYSGQERDLIISFRMADLRNSLRGAV